jgi:hypothetical protein
MGRFGVVGDAGLDCLVARASNMITRVDSERITANAPHDAIDPPNGRHRSSGGESGRPRALVAMRPPSGVTRSRMARHVIERALHHLSHTLARQHRVDVLLEPHRSKHTQAHGKR